MQMVLWENKVYITHCKDFKSLRRWMGSGISIQLILQDKIISDTKSSIFLRLTYKLVQIKSEAVAKG